MLLVSLFLMSGLQLAAGQKGGAKGAMRNRGSKGGGGRGGGGSRNQADDGDG